MAQKNNLIGGRELEQINNSDPLTGRLFRRVIAAIQTLGTNTGTSPMGEHRPPPSIGAVNVKAHGEMVHVTLSDAAVVTRPIEYHLEYANNPDFSTPHHEHLVTGKGRFLNLPAKDDEGNPQQWYFRGYSQYPGSQPSAPVYFGGLSPTAVALTGTTNLTPLTSPGSGTASPTGQQGGWGRGKTFVRPAQGARGPA